MAKSAVTSYSSLLKEIADGLTEQDVGDIKLLLRYPAAVKISTGTQLLVEMQRQDDLDEDNLVTLKDALGKQKLKRLVKIVEKFEQASSDTSQGDPLTKSWPCSAFKEQTKDDRLSQSANSAGIQDQLQRRQTQVQQNLQGAAPPASYQGNLPQDYPQQPQLLPGVGYPMQQMDPSLYQQSPQSQHQQRSQYPGSTGYPNQQQLTLQQQQQQQLLQQQQHLQMLLSQQQQQQQQQQYIQSHTGQFVPVSPAQAQYPVAPLQQGYQPYTGSQPPPGSEQHTMQRVKSVPSSTTAPPGGSGHAKAVPTKSCPSQIGRAPQELTHLLEEEEVGLKRFPSNVQTTKEMNIPAVNTYAVAEKMTGEKTVNGNIVMGTSSLGGEYTPNGVASQFMGGNTQAMNIMNGRGQGTIPYQAARVRVNSEEKNNESIGEGVHPVSQQMTETEADLLLLSGFSGKKLYDFRKVDFIAIGSYQVRIPQGVHYHTTEGAFAILPFNSPYTIQLRNIDERLRCSALVENNGKIAGEWTIDPKGFIVLERPAMDQKKFHFMEARCAPSGSGVRLDDPNNGVICVTFTPEKDETLNDLSRGFGHFSISSNGDYFESGDMNDVQRSIAPRPVNDRQVGCTVLQGESHQRFTRSEHFQLDTVKKTRIVLKLVGKST
ncbi:uncharacterized protein LOC117299045 [Asterias rubens]|uniref:uncharacterized protein LOC117299045 n=1 Tax=Asterias rubens TaxID=7604 RepID=UPI001455C01C|nr:uncharacterized protein LOC117299045 [Asterias rubens]